MAEEDKETKKIDEKANEQKISEAELAMEQKMRKKKEEEEAMWAEFIEQRKKQKAKEEEDLRKLKEKQLKRKDRRAEEDKKLMALKKQQEAQRVREMEEKKAREAEAKRKRLEEAEKKRQAFQEALSRKKAQDPVTPNFIIAKKNEEGGPILGQFTTPVHGRPAVVKTKEQLLEDKQMALAVRVKPLQLEGMAATQLRQKAEELWELIVRQESEKYDLEERRKRQEYDLKELSERQRQINRSKALKKGLDPEALSGKFPPMINVASKYERRLDRRNFNEKKCLYEGGYLSNYEASLSNQWEDKIKNFKDRGPSRLLKWDPNAPKVKENPEPRKEEDDEELEVPLPFLENDQNIGEDQEEPQAEEKTENEQKDEDEESEEEEEDEEE